MSTKSLIVVTFGDCNINFRRHWGGDPVVAGSEILDHLASAETIKPRQDFHTGSWFLRLMFLDGFKDGAEHDLPTYEAHITNDGIYGDWEIAYQIQFNSDGKWKIGYVASCDGEPWAEIADNALWFTPEEFRSFIDKKYVDDQAAGVEYDVGIRGVFLNSLKNKRK